MNTYNDNLHSSVVKSLNSQEAEIQSVQAELDASIYSLYYAQGAKITGEEQLAEALAEYNFQAKIKKQAVDCNSLAVNVNTIALDQKKYTAASVTNTATAAADVQIATNAIIRLASNMGSIFSIVNAADYGQDIYHQSRNAYEKMNQTAYEAEVASKLSMEASLLTAEVPYNTVADQAKGTSTAVANMLTIASADFDNASGTLTAKNDDLAKASDTEKAAEGMVEYLNTDYNSTKKAYIVNNNELNLALQVPQKTITDHSYVVNFNNYISPFHNIIRRESDDLNKQLPAYKAVILTSDKMSFPVDFYYIFLVKNSNQPIFSIAEAEGLIANAESGRYKKIPAPPIPIIPETADINYPKSESLFNPKNIPVEIEMNTLLDSDGDAMMPGKDYVVFVLAVFDPAYQKAINNFDEYLTASSEKFALTNHLASPAPAYIRYFPPVKTETGQEFSAIVAFALLQDPAYKVQYRGIFLPDNTDLLKSLLTENHLNKVGDEIQDYEYLLDYYISKIDDLDARIAAADDDYNAFDEEIKKAKEDKNEKRVKELEEKQRALKNLVAEMTKERDKLEKEMEAFTKNITAINKTIPGFFFNRNLAEKLLIPNYSVADTITIILSTDEKQSDKMIWDKIKADAARDKVFTAKYGNMPADKNVTEHFKTSLGDLYKETLYKLKEKVKKTKEPLPEEITITLGIVEIRPDTSDNFGNLLIPSNRYLPAMLSFSTDEESQDFTNALSDFSETAFFTYPDNN